MTEITTERLRLRPFKDGDANAMYNNWTCDERVAKYCRWYPHNNISETEMFLEYCKGAEYCWAITLKDKDEPIGCVDVVRMSEDNVPELGYVLGYDYWGKGIMTEAVKAVIAEFIKFGFNKIEACHNIDNPASGKVMEKAGMTYSRNSMAVKKFGSDELVEVKYYEIIK